MGGSQQLQTTGLPGAAAPNVSTRLAPGQQVEEIAPAFERLLHEAAPAGAEIDVERWSAAPPGLVDPRSPAIALGLDAFERVFGVRPALVRHGGTMPIVATLSERGIPPIVTRVAPPHPNIHAPNERLRVEDIR